MLYTDVKYANLLQSYVRNYKRKGDYLWNFSCPFCNDSQKNKLKARGYLYKGGQGNLGLFYHCHNCSHSTNIGKVIELLDINLYKEYALEKYKDSGAPRTPHKNIENAIPDIFQKSNDEVIDKILDPLIPVNSLQNDHPVMNYVKSRQLPRSCYDRLFVAPSFKKYINGLIPNKISGSDQPRLVIPYLNAHGKCFALQGRAFGKEQPKYYTIKFDDEEDCVFGLDKINYSKHIYVLEGPIDSLFISNAVAVSGSSFDIDFVKKIKSNCTLVYDNEPRSKQLTNNIKNMIDKGYKVCMWPETIPYKDVNEMIINGMTPASIIKKINENSFQNLEAKLKFRTWKKCL